MFYVFLSFWHDEDSCLELDLLLWINSYQQLFLYLVCFNLLCIVKDEFCLLMDQLFCSLFQLNFWPLIITIEFYVLENYSRKTGCESKTNQGLIKTGSLTKPVQSAVFQLPLPQLTRVVVANMYFSRSWKLSTCSRITLRLCSLWKKSVLLSTVETPWGSFLWTSTVVGGS